MRFLVRLVPPDSEQTRAVDRVKTLARPFGIDPKNPKRTSYGAVELDLFAPSRGAVELFLAAVGPLMEVEFLTDLNVSPPHRTALEAMEEAKRLFNAERYWECHEVLEGEWRTKEGGEKRLLQGGILICAAYVHHQKGEEGVALGILRRAVEALGEKPPKYGPLDLTLMWSNAVKMLDTGAIAEFRI